jgi:hypothetical protein
MQRARERLVAVEQAYRALVQRHSAADSRSKRVGGGVGARLTFSLRLAVLVHVASAGTPHQLSHLAEPQGLTRFWETGGVPQV